MRVVPYIQYGQKTGIETELCRDAFLLMEIERDKDRLGQNYSYSKLKLDEMEHFNFVFDGNNPVCVSGSQKLSGNVVRVFTRYYAFDDYRTDGTNLLEKVDDFLELKYSMERLTHYPLVIWSRDKSPSFFKRLKAGRPDIFSDWQVHDSKVPIKYKNNEQYIFYCGDISHVSEIHPTM